MNTDTAAYCDNCQTTLQGPFCHHCGQEKTVLLCSVKHLLQDFFSAIGSWDSRLWRTLLPLWFRPAFLSNQYISGHRAPYAPPLRLYLFTSIIAFLIFSSATQIDTFATGNNNNGTNTTNISKEQYDAAEAAILAEIYNHSPALAKSHQKLNLSVAFLSEEQQRALNENLQKKQELVAQHPSIAVAKFFSLAPQMLLCLMPILALILKLMYCFRQRYYVEHLILALHTHTFLLQMMLLCLGLHYLQSLLSNLPMLVSLINNTMILVFGWMLLYLLLAQKNYYRQSWRMTVFKFLLTGWLYLAILLIGIVCVALLSILWA